MTLKESVYPRKPPEVRAKISAALKGKYAGEKNPMFGQSHTEETKQKISIAKKGKPVVYIKGHADVSGNKNPFYGKNHTVETKEKISLAKRGHCYNIGRKHTVETKLLIGEKARIRFQTGMQIPLLKGKHQPEEVRRLISEKAKARFSNPENHPFFGRKLTPVHKAKISRLGSTHTKETRDKIAKASRLHWLNEGYARKVLSYTRPNKKEAQLDNILKDLSLPYRYVGDGQFILGGKCPDFLNANGQKKLIELYGNFWHQGENPQNRIDYFKQYGFDTLIIWEDELSNQAKLKEKLIAFDSQNFIKEHY